MADEKARDKFLRGTVGGTKETAGWSKRKQQCESGKEMNGVKEVGRRGGMT